MKYVVRVVLGLVLFAFTISLAPAPHAAAAGFNVITSPLPIKLSVKPGQTTTTELRIKNQNTTAEGIKVGLMKFGATGENGTPTIDDLTAKDEYGSWVTFSPSSFLAQPNVWYTIKMTIKVPASAQLGYYMAVTFSPANVPGAPDATTLKGSAATLVLLDVQSGNTKRELELVSFTSKHMLYEYLPASFSVRVRNKGNIYTSPTGNIFIERSGKPIDTIDVNAIGGSVLPQTNRTFVVPWNNGFPRFVDRIVDGKPVPDGKGQNSQSLSWDFSQANKFRFGKYTARLLLVYDNGKQDVPLQSTLTFWVIPWKIMLVLLLLLFVIGFGVFTMLRGVVRRARRQTTRLKRHDR